MFRLLISACTVLVLFSCKKKELNLIDESNTVFYNLNIIKPDESKINVLSALIDTSILDSNTDYSQVNLFSQLSHPDSVFVSYNVSFYYASASNNANLGLKPILFRLTLREKVSKSLIDTTFNSRFKFKNDEDFYNSFSLGKIKFSVNDTYRAELAAEMLMNINNDFYRTLLLNDTTENINNNAKYYFDITGIYLDKNSKSVYLNVEFVAPWALMNTMTNYTIQGKARIKISNKFTN